MPARHDLPPSHFGRRTAEHGPLLNCLKRHLGARAQSERLLQIVSGGQIRVPEKPLSRRPLHTTGSNFKCCRLHTKLAGGGFQQQLARCGAGLANGWNRRGSCTTSRRASVVGHEGGIGHHHADFPNRHSQLFSCSLGNLGPGSLADFHLARHHSHHTGRVDVQPFHPRHRSTGTRALGVNGRTRQGNQNPRTEYLGEFATTQFEPIGRALGQFISFRLGKLGSSQLQVTVHRVLPS